MQEGYATQAMQSNNRKKKGNMKSVYDAQE